MNKPLTASDLAELERMLAESGVGGQIIEHRSEDSHDVLGTFAAATRSPWRDRPAQTADEFLSWLRNVLRLTTQRQRRWPVHHARNVEAHEPPSPRSRKAHLVEAKRTLRDARVGQHQAKPASEGRQSSVRVDDASGQLLRHFVLPK